MVSGKCPIFLKKVLGVLEAEINAIACLSIVITFSEIGQNVAKCRIYWAWDILPRPAEECLVLKMVYTINR